MTERSRVGRLPTLSRRQILRAALELAERDGVEAITLRSVAAHLGVYPMTLYSYVTGKADLLAGTVDVIFERIELLTDGDPLDRLIDGYVALRWAFVPYPQFVAQVGRTQQLGVDVARFHEHAYDLYRRVGFDLETTATMHSALFSLTLMSALIEGNTLSTGMNPSDMVHGMRAQLSELDPAAFPLLRQMAGKPVTGEAARPAFARQIRFLLEAAVNSMGGLRVRD